MRTERKIYFELNEADFLAALAQLSDSINNRDGKLVDIKKYILNGKVVGIIVVDEKV